MKDNTDNRTNKGKRSKVITAVLIAVMVIISFVGGYFANYLINSKSINVATDLIRIMEEVGYIYDPSTGERREITEKDVANALVGALLDDYSAYYTEEEYEKIMSESEGSYSGLGLSVYVDAPIVFKVFGNSPADRAGIEAGDKFLSVVDKDGITKEIKSTDELMTYFDSFSAEEQMNVAIDRNGVQKVFTLKKEEYITSYVTYYDSGARYRFLSNESGETPVGTEDDNGMKELDGATAYVRLDMFEGDAATQMRDALDFMVERGRSKLILDLRDNGGGYMHVLTEVAACLIHNDGKGGMVVAYSSGKADNMTFKTSGNYFNEEIKAISVIANENTASASECLIGAMLCYGDRFSMERLVVEKNSNGVAKTYGKGIMQTTYELLSGGAFKLTTAQILWPDNKTCIHGKGILPLEANAVNRENAISRAAETLSD